MGLTISHAVAHASCEHAPCALLAVECGSLWTRATLLGPVDGRLRFIAQGVTRASEQRSVHAALERIASLTGIDDITLTDATITGDGGKRVMLITDQHHGQRSFAPPAAPSLTPLTALARCAEILAIESARNTLVIEMGAAATRLAYANLAGHVERFTAPGIGNDMSDARRACAILSTAAQHIGQAQVDVMLGTGALLGQILPVAEATHLLLAGVQPRGVCQIFLDAANCALAFGAASLLTPTLALDGLLNDALLYATTCVILPEQTIAWGGRPLRAELRYGDEQRAITEISAGEVFELPLAPGQCAELTLHPASGVDCGGGRGIPVMLSPDIEGGQLGALIDTRLVHRRDSR